MVRTKIAVSLDAALLRDLDRWVTSREYPNRSRALDAGVMALKERRTRRRRFLAELARLDPAEERRLAEEKLAAEVAWPAS